MGSYFKQGARYVPLSCSKSLTELLSDSNVLIILRSYSILTTNTSSCLGSQSCRTLCNREELSTTCNPKVTSNACQCLMLHPYITASRTIVNLKLNSGVGYKGTSLKRICYSFLYSSCIVFPDFSSFLGDNQSYVSISHTILNCA